MRMGHNNPLSFQPFPWDKNTKKSVYNYPLTKNTISFDSKRLQTFTKTETICPSPWRHLQHFLRHCFTTQSHTTQGLRCLTFTNFGLGLGRLPTLVLSNIQDVKKDFSDGSFALNTWMLSCWSNADVLGSVSFFWPQKINVKTCPELRMVRRLPLKKTM